MFTSELTNWGTTLAEDFLTVSLYVPYMFLYVPYIFSIYVPYIFLYFPYIFLYFPICSYIFLYIFSLYFPMYYTPFIMKSHVLHTFHHEIFWALQPRQPARAWYITTLPSLQPMTTLFCLRQKWLGHAWPQWHGKLR